MADTDDERHPPQAGDRVGLGRVVSTDMPAREPTATDEVDEGSEESFPASDPTAFTATRPAPSEPAERRPDDG